MQKYTYLKPGEASATSRVLHGEIKPDTLIKALDVSNLIAKDQTKAVGLYDRWLEEHLKPFEKEVATLKKEKLKPLQVFFIENGLLAPPEVKSFKCAGLTLGGADAVS